MLKYQLGMGLHGKKPLATLKTALQTKKTTNGVHHHQLSLWYSCSSVIAPSKMLLGWVCFYQIGTCFVHFRWPMILQATPPLLLSSTQTSVLAPSYRNPLQLNIVSANFLPPSPIHFQPWGIPKEREPPSHRVDYKLHMLGPVGSSFDIGLCGLGVCRSMPTR